MTLYQWFTILGLPTISGLIIKWKADQIKEREKAKRNNEAEYRNIKEGIKALLRAQMLNDYEYYSKLAYAPIPAREIFEDCYKQYHNLGGNGVMDDIHDKFMALPTDPPEVIS